MAPTPISDLLDAEGQDPGSPAWDGFSSEAASPAVDLGSLVEETDSSTLESLSLVDQLHALSDKEKLEYGADGTCDWCFNHLEINSETNKLVNPYSGPEFKCKWGCQPCREKQLVCTFAARHKKTLKKIKPKTSVEEQICALGKKKLKLASQATINRIHALGAKLKALQNEYEELVASL
ncbi:hypothetical protein CALCODRAFT_539055 [Calocera cornea HHB12733]|uniref:Uncharacterized protein n=1 Tax=Calocera cornea HHB12733 TaxID=1353952 RepID=A0A165GUY0_9BASI|nr:hypothetical protein CALCODRAFT_539055 [Calocera cornea HHB12733]